MNQTLIVQELAIVVAAKDFNHTIFSPDFLKYSGIISSEWEFEKQPILNNNMAQFNFKNGLNIVAEPNRVIFAESVIDKTNETVLVPEIIRKYTRILPNLDFQAVGINPKGFVAFTQEDESRKFINERMLSPNISQQQGEVPMRASLNLIYQFQRAPLSLNITEAFLRQEDQNIPIVMFNGAFSYQFRENSLQKKQDFVNQTVDNWFTDIQTFCDLINNKFINSVNGNIQLEDPWIKVADANPEQFNLFTISADV